MLDKDLPYEPGDVEHQVQEYWKENESFSVTEDHSKEKYFCLSMFPYPSGSIHMGHVRNYTIGDAISRFQRMLGKNVLQPMGWDAFGLPAENAAIDNKVQPSDWTSENIESMKKQLTRLGFAYDWKREFATSESDYYKWEQWFFLQMLEKGLAYQEEAEVNWDPVDQTVLANEQVIDGKGWRSGAEVEKRILKQWFLKITDYAEELLQGTDKLDGWPDQVKTQQKNWIGKSEGMNFSFGIEDRETVIDVFTTRPDTIMGVSFIAISSSHFLISDLAEKRDDIREFVEKQNKIKVSEAEFAKQEKEGIFTNLFAIHPFTKEKIPIWIANFVLSDYGSGALMAVPAHDQRDFEFATKYKLPILPVIKNNHDEVKIQEATTEKNKILPTILSRCQIYDFNRIKDSEISNCLKDICKKEGFEFEDEAVSIISRKSDGSLRDSLTILDRIVSFTNKNITTEKTSALLNILDNESYLNISKNIFEKDLISSIISFNKICEKGFNEKDFLTGLASHFRNILISKSNESHSLFEFSNEIMNSFIEQGNMVSNSELVDHITIVESSIFKYNQVENKKLLVEITLMKLCKVNQSNQINDKTVEKKKDDLRKSIQDSKIKKNELPQKINTKIDTKREKIKDLNVDSEIEPKKIENPEISALSLSSLKLKKEVNIEKEKEKENKIPLENKFDLDALKLHWKKYSKNLSEKGNNSLSSLMEISEPLIFEENKILFNVPSKSNKKEIDLDRENICDFLKSNLKNDQIVLEVNIDESMNKEYYSTPQEKFDKLNEINPILNEFKKDLKLDL